MIQSLPKSPNSEHHYICNQAFNIRGCFKFIIYLFMYLCYTGDQTHDFACQTGAYATELNPWPDISDLNNSMFWFVNSLI